MSGHPLRQARVAFLALIFIPLFAIPIYLVGWKVGKALDPINHVGWGVVPGVVAPALACVFVIRWAAPTNWFVAIALGILGGGIALFVLVVALIVGCGATNCGS